MKLPESLPLSPYALGVSTLPPGCQHHRNEEFGVGCVSQTHSDGRASRVVQTWYADGLPNQIFTEYGTLAAAVRELPMPPAGGLVTVSDLLPVREGSTMSCCVAPLQHGKPVPAATHVLQMFTGWHPLATQLLPLGAAAVKQYTKSKDVTALLTARAQQQVQRVAMMNTML